MAAVAISPVVLPELERDEIVALERDCHGRSRDASRPGETWGGVMCSRRVVSWRDAAVGERDPSRDLVSHLMTLAVRAGLADDMTLADSQAVTDAVRKGARRLVVFGDPVMVQELRVTAPSLGAESLHVVGTCSASARDSLNALADLTVGHLVPGRAPWAIVRNPRGRALLDALDATVWCDAVAAADFGAMAEVATTAWHGRRPRMVP
ncbi:MAG: hypothetical protein MUF53_12220 [Gemmatimonadaceae bacterium]|nr:hypothetical protein [Gemmatimonadaceae bacterium]